MCGRLVNLDTVARVLADYYHLKTETQLAALDEALSRVPAETVGKELFGISEQLNDLISRQAAIKKILGQPPEPHYPSWYAEQIKELPSAEPEPLKIDLSGYSKEDWERFRKEWANIPMTVLPEQRTGKWISADAIFGGVPFYCSECGENTRDTVMGKPRWNFCPNCGADMRGEQDERSD